MGAAYIFDAGDVHDLVEGPPAVVLANGIALLKADMIVGSNEYAYCIRICQHNVS